MFLWSGTPQIDHPGYRYLIRRHWSWFLTNFRSMGELNLFSRLEFVMMWNSKFSRINIWNGGRKDTYGVYAEPVDPEEVCDFHPSYVVVSAFLNIQIWNNVCCCSFLTITMSLIILWTLLPWGISWPTDHIQPWNSLRWVFNSLVGEFSSTCTCLWGYPFAEFWGSKLVLAFPSLWRSNGQLVVECR